MITLTVGGGMYGCPLYGVYQQRLLGESELARPDFQRRTAVVEAQAKMDAAKLLTQAKVERAKDLAETNTILGRSLQGEQGAAYLRYLWIQKMEEGTLQGLRTGHLALASHPGQRRRVVRAPEHKDTRARRRCLARSAKGERKSGGCGPDGKHWEPKGGATVGFT